ncbi:hypothetical protein BC936DRAFT_147469 [Jimgerdemannia flammicorona]|uniref:Uncharacterized protein n=1 Tax=Jimgerdemannia flammicorona TaxID=994334 RepID=A0A433D593_9FUNG|nr:hypothetical protein BC936DRAFT_147469 [Jimgerdemannia flammicorona]
MWASGGTPSTYRQYFAFVFRRSFEDAKSVRPLWNNSAVLTVVKRATEIVRAHSHLDKVTEDRLPLVAKM